MQSHDLLVNFVIYLAAAVAAVPLARRLGLGSVLGYLLAGVIVGPWGLRLITNVQSILDFSEFGVVLMMFVIGLELEPARLWSLRRSIFGYGGLQLAVCALMVGLAVMAVGHPWRAAVVAGLGLALSSTAIALAHESKGTADARKGFWLTGVGIYFFWNLATLLGALGANALGDPAQWGLDATIPAAFLGLLWPRLTSQLARVVAISAVALALILTPLLTPGLPIIACVLIPLIAGWRMRS